MTRRWRSELGWSQAELARRAGVPASTVRRIETCEIDPTLTMLQRVAAAAGKHIAIVATPVAEIGPSLADLATRAGRSDGSIDWTQMRTFADWCDRHADRVADAIHTPPARSGNDRLDNLTAAFAERVADTRGLDRPSWTRAVKPLLVAWHLEGGTPRMRAHSTAAAPPQFSARNIHLAEDSVWRRPQDRTHAS